MLATQRLRRRPSGTALLLVLIVLLNAAWVAHFGLRLHGLAIYDEKFAVEGARWLHDDLHHLTAVPGFGDRGVERLTAALLVPGIWLSSTTADQFVFGHLVLALVFALQAVPAFLLTRALTGSERWSLFAGALAVFGPWAVFGMVFLNNAPAACAAAFALWAMWRAVTTPSARWDALAIAFVVLGTLARVSSAVLIVALPFAIAGYAVMTRDRQTLRRHWLLGVAALAGIAWLATGHVHTLVGQYPTSVHTTAGVVVTRILTTFAHLGAGTGFVALAFGGAWVVRQSVRPVTPEAGAFALLVVAWFVTVGYVNLASGVDERYELVLFVPLAVTFSAALARRDAGLIATVIGALVVWWALHRHGDLPFAQVSDYLTWPSREWLSRVWLNKAQFSLGIGRQVALALVGLALAGAAVALALVRGERRAWVAAAIGAFALVYAFAGSGWAMTKLSAGHRPGASFAAKSFIDRLTGGARTDAFGSTAETDAGIPHLWDEVQFFNGAMLHPLSLEGPVYALCCGSAGLDQVAQVDRSTGAVSSDAPLPPFIATVPEWLPAGFASTLVFASSAYTPSVRLERLREPPTAAWISTGFDNYGWVRPRQQARLRVFPAGAPGRPACLRATLQAPTQVAGGQTRWHVDSMGSKFVAASGAIAAGRAARVDVPLRGDRPIDLAVGADVAGPDPVLGQPGFIGLSDLRLARCGAAEPAPKLAP